MATITPDQIVGELRNHLGAPYVWGADGPSSFDCSGLVQFVFDKLGLKVPRTSQEQYNWSQGISIPVSEAQPGDLVFYSGSDGSPSSPGHVGVYIGNNEIIHAPRTGQPVKVAPITSPGQPTAVKRMPNVSGSATGGTGTTATQTGVNIPGLGSLGGLLSIPGDITNFFKGATDSLTHTAAAFSLFFQPSTYIRIGSGIFGLMFLIVSLIFLIREAQKYRG